MNNSGIKYALVSTVWYTLLVVGVKYIGTSLPTAQVVFARMAIALVLIFPLTSRKAKADLLALRFIASHMLRAVLGIAAIFCTFYGIARLPLSESTALSYSTPLMLVVLARIILGEFVPAVRWLAVVCGAIGVVIISQPEGGTNFVPVMAILVGCAAIAVNNLLVRSLSRKCSSEAIVLAFFSLGSLLAVPIAVTVWQTPTPSQAAALIFMGLAGGLFQCYQTKALQSISASAIAPFLYCSIMWSIVCGWLLWSEIPKWTEVAGVMLILVNAMLGFCSVKVQEAK